LFSLVGAACFYWLERLQPVFFTVALLALAYEIWLVGRRPGGMRSTSVWAMVAFSLSVNMIVVGTWVFLWIRYR
jgi:hypothetical protein